MDGIETVRRELHRGRYLRAVELATQQLAALDPANPEAGELRLLRGNAQRAGGKRQEAMDEFTTLVADSDAAGQPGLALRARLDRSRLLINMGDLRRAEEDVSFVRDSSGALPPLGLGELHFNVGRLSIMRDENDAAATSFEAALAAHQAAGNEYGMAEAQSALAMTCVKQGRHLDGISLWRKALVYHENEGNTAEVAVQLQRISFATWCEGDLETTRRTLLHVLRLGEEDPEALPPHLRMTANYNLCGLEQQAGELELAGWYLAEARAQATVLGDKALLANAPIQEAALELLQGNSTAAFAARETAIHECAALGLGLSPADWMYLALARTAHGDLAGGASEWPTFPYGNADREQVMALRGVLQVVEALLERSQDVATQEQLDLWRLQLKALTAG